MTSQLKKSNYNLNRAFISVMARLWCPLPLSALILLGAMLALPKVSECATFYVATTGSDSNSGGISQPFGTIGKGISVLAGGDTLYIRAGIYNEAINSGQQTIPTGTSWSSAVTIASYPGEKATLNAVTLYHSYVKYIIFDGLILANSGALDQPFYLSNGANHVRAKNCEMRNGNFCGVVISKGSTGGTNYNEIINCNIHHNGVRAKYDHGIYILTDNNLVEGSEIHHNAAFGVHVYGDGSPANNNIVRNNKVYSNGVLAGTSFGILLASGSNNVAYNNLVYDNGAGITTDLSSTNAKIYNNTVYSNTREGYAGIVVGSGATGAVVKNNIVYQNAGAITNQGSGTVSSNNLTANPIFLNPTAGDFHLQSGSPAVDAGVPVTEVTVDYDLVPRPQGSNLDIGAFEYRSGQQVSSGPTNLRIVSP
jgi:parallel beta-helix repeat protein